MLLFSSLGHAATFVTVRQQSARQRYRHEILNGLNGGSVQVFLQSGNRFEVFVNGANSLSLHSFIFTGPEVR